MSRKKADLCLDCALAGQCLLRRESSARVVCCDRFRSRFPADATADDNSSAARSADDAPNADLCATCSKRSTCTAPKREGGVWRCRDYC